MTKFKPKVKLHFKIPVYYNNGKSVNAEKFVNVKNHLMEIYGGLTIDTPAMGYWVESKVEYQDKTIEYMILVGKEKFYSKIEPKLLDEIENFKKEFEQLEILCYYYDVIST